MRRYGAELRLTRSQVVWMQTGLLKAELVNGLPPGNLSKSQEQAVKDTKKVFFAGREGGKPLDIFFGPKAQGKGMRWLYAGPKYVVGVFPDDFRPSISGTEMQREMNELRRGHFRGAAWHEVGKRGTQHVYRVNRTVVRRGDLSNLRKQVVNSFGKLKASFAVDWEKFRIARPLRRWIARHVPTAKGRTVDMSKAPDDPYVEIISSARGVSSERALKAIRAAVRKRTGAMLADLRNQLNGAYKRAGFANAR